MPLLLALVLVPAVLARALDVAEPAERFAARVFPRQPGGDQLVDAHLHVNADLLVHVVANHAAGAPEKPERPAGRVGRHRIAYDWSTASTARA